MANVSNNWNHAKYYIDVECDTSKLDIVISKLETIKNLLVQIDGLVKRPLDKLTKYDRGDCN